MKELLQIVALVCCTAILFVLPLTWPVFIIVLFLMGLGGVKD
jgi:hypothetical protein